MKCVFCKEGNPRPQRVTVQRHNSAGEPVAVIRNFPTEVCQVCGEESYLAEDWEKAERVLERSPLRVAEVPVYASFPCDSTRFPTLFHRRGQSFFWVDARPRSARRPRAFTGQRSHASVLDKQTLVGTDRPAWSSSLIPDY